jgi:hypothetical protein
MKLTPNWLKVKVHSSFKTAIKETRRNQLKKIPQHNLQKKHIQNTKLLTNRDELLEMLPTGGIVAELGVDMGHFSERILTLNKPKKLHLIDVWQSKRYHQGKQKQVEERFKDEIASGQVEINLGLSTDIASDFPDNYFDWIYIDTVHTYEVTAAELAAYRTKVKEGGFICGHDYVLFNWTGLARYGVIESVSEFCTKHDWEIQYLTTELDSNPSFAIKKIK